MCGRYAAAMQLAELYAQMAFLEGDKFFDWDSYKPRAEIFPGTEIMAVNNERRAENIWWTIEAPDNKGVMRRAINAKAETIHFVEMFKNAYKTDRILIPATHIFEWQEQPDKKKIKYRIGFDEPVFAFGGIARDCEIKGATRRCGVIMTTKPNEVFAEIHNTKQRQAVVIRQADYDAWLDPSTPSAELKRLVQPLPSSETHYEPAEPLKPTAQSLF
jgi:putative SOS response-associated peptidase YedK